MASEPTSASGSAPFVPADFVGKRPPGARDPAWKYAYLGPIPGTVYCIPCKKVYRGGINRLKYHLAGIPQRDAKECPHTTEEIKRQMNAILSAAEEKKMKREMARAAMQATIASSQGVPVESDDDYDVTQEIQEIVGSLRGPRVRRSRQPIGTSTSIPSSSSSRAPGARAATGPTPTRLDSFFCA